MCAISQTNSNFNSCHCHALVHNLRSAHLLYFVVKNHSFSDGNKRIAAFLFIWFMEKNGLLYWEDGSKRIADNVLVALTLMIAESKPDEGDHGASCCQLINGYNF